MGTSSIITPKHKTTTFLNWAVEEGRLEANPLAGFRKRRETRAERLRKPRRMLSDAELAILFQTCADLQLQGSIGQRMMSAIVQILILTGQRRTETSRMRFADISQDGEWWTIPALEAKNGLAHEVPLPQAARDVIRALPRSEGCQWIFTTSGKSPVSGWSKLEEKIRSAAAARGLQGRWTLHDLRRSFRSGLTRLKIDSDVAEIMLNHRPERIRSIYDLEPRFDDRKQAAAAWSEHLQNQIGQLSATAN